MKTIVKEHPLRAIILNFDLTKEAPEFETKALEAYYLEHDQTWTTKQNLLQHKDALYQLDIAITESEYMLLPIEQQLDFLEMGLQLVEGVELPIMDKEFSIDVGAFFKEVLAHNKAMDEFYADLLAEWEWFDRWADYIYEHEDWCQPNQRYLIHEVYRRYKEVSVDIVSLDKDQQAFFGAHGEVRDLQKDYFDYGNQVFAMYNRVKDRAEAAYHRSERLNVYINENFPDKK